MLGMTEDDFPDSVCWVWRQNWKAFSVFADLQTQWRMGMGGPIGLDYNALPVVFRMNGVARNDQPELFECLRVMESEALSLMHRKE